MPEIHQVSPEGREYIEIPLSELRAGDTMLSWHVDRGSQWYVTDVSQYGDRVTFTREGFGQRTDEATSRRHISPVRGSEATTAPSTRWADLVERYGFPAQVLNESDYYYAMRCMNHAEDVHGRDSAVCYRMYEELWPQSGVHVSGSNARARWMLDTLLADGAPQPDPTEFAFPDSETPVPAHRHPRGRGWVANTASVNQTAFVARTAMVYGYAVVDYGAGVRDNAQVYEHGFVERYASVQDNAQVYGHGGVLSEATVGGTALVHGNAQIHPRDGYVSHGDITEPTVWRRCTRCNSTMRGTTENFSQSRGRFNAWCRECMRTYARERRAAATNNRPGNRRFGIEIEFHGSQHDVEVAMRRAGLACEMEGYNHRVRNHWKIVGDASVSNGGELVSPILRGRSGFAAIRKACTALREAGASVSIETGLHVHHDVAGLTVSAFKRMVANWYRCQEGIDEMVSPSRRDGQWSHHLDSYDIQAVNRQNDLPSMRNAFGGMDRYKSLNLNAYSVHGTVEVRMHQGTLNPDKIISWVKFGQAFISAAVDGVDLDHERGSELLGALTHLDTTACEFLRRRIRALASDPHSDEGEQDYDRYQRATSGLDDDYVCAGCGFEFCECEPEYVPAAGGW